MKYYIEKRKCLETNAFGEFPVTRTYLKCGDFETEIVDYTIDKDDMRVNICLNEKDEVYICSNQH